MKASLRPSTLNWPSHSQYPEFHSSQDSPDPPDNVVIHFPSCKSTLLHSAIHSSGAGTLQTAFLCLLALGRPTVPVCPWLSPSEHWNPLDLVTRTVSYSSWLAVRFCTYVTLEGGIRGYRVPILLAVPVIAVPAGDRCHHMAASVGSGSRATQMPQQLAARLLWGSWKTFWGRCYLKWISIETSAEWSNKMSSGISSRGNGSCWGMMRQNVQHAPGTARHCQNRDCGHRRSRQTSS